MTTKRNEFSWKSGLKSLMVWGMLLGMLLVSNAVASPVSKDDALSYAKAWLEVSNNPLGATISGRTIKDAFEIKNSAGELLAWNVQLVPQGFVILSADDCISPVISFSAAGSFDASNANSPLVDLLLSDAAARVQAVKAAVAEAGTRALPQAMQENRNAWNLLKNAGTRTNGINYITEVWVAPFMTTAWNQGSGIYNYYTPTIYDDHYSFEEPGNPDNIVCGCVATSEAQIMRYFQWPQKKIGYKEGSCTITLRDEVNYPNPISITKALRGGDGNGGAYDWSVMSDIPNSESSQDTYKQIGALCFDVGLSVGMAYNQDNKKSSGANSSTTSYKDFFDYAGASGASSDQFDFARANLDARRPMNASWSPANPLDTGAEAHCAVVDGYGKMCGRWFYHINCGWGAGNNVWYSLEEVYMGVNNNSFKIRVGNIYRQRLQENEDAEKGVIISGRVVDGNGNPVSGVKVSLRKKGESATWLTMLAWYDPIDPEETPVYRDWDQAGNNNGTLEDSELPGADKYRNTTDKNGIWAIDKVPTTQDFEIVLEKDGLCFAGTKSFKKLSSNQWGVSFVASAMENLALESWWRDGNTVYLQFNRAVGNVQADASQIKIGNKSLSGCDVQVTPSSNLVVIYDVPNSVTGTSLTMQEGFLFIDIDGETTVDQDGMNDAPVVSVAPAVTNMAKGNAVVQKVTSIKVKNDDPTNENTITFVVTGTDLDAIPVTDFKLRLLTTGKTATALPNAAIDSWNATTGELVVRANNGEAYIYVDYVPANGDGTTGFVSASCATFDDCGPAIISAELDYNNNYVDITWNEPVKAETVNYVRDKDLNVILHNNGGSITRAQIYSVTKTSATDKDGAALTAPSETMRVWIEYTPSLEVQLNASQVTDAEDLPISANEEGNQIAYQDPSDDRVSAYQVPAGVETIEVVPREGCVYDELQNVASANNTTQPLLLNDSRQLRMVSAVMGHDNYSILFTFNKRVFGVQVDGKTGSALLYAEGDYDEWQEMNGANITAVVNYQDSEGNALVGQEETLSISNSAGYQYIKHNLGTNTIYIDFFAETKNRTSIDPSIKHYYMDGVDKKEKIPASITVTFGKLYDKEGTQLIDNEITVPIRYQSFTPGKASLMPPFFTNRRDSYTHIKANPKAKLSTSDPVYCQQDGNSDYHSGAALSDGSGLYDSNEDCEGLVYHGVWYRDLDGDGRIDAVDLNFHNPQMSSSNYATLKCGTSTIANMTVWAQTKDPDDLDSEENNFFPADDEGMPTFPAWADYPFSWLDEGLYANKERTRTLTGKNDKAIYDFRQGYKKYPRFSSNWEEIPITGVEVVKENKYDSRNYSSNNYVNETYSTLRVTIDQTKMPYRTYGERFIMVSYNAPRSVQKSYPRNGSDYPEYSYNGYMIANATAPSKDVTEDYQAYSDADEEAGIYWYQAYTGNRGDGTGKGIIDTYFICDGFGPVVAWDGAEAAPIAATTWRATPYPKTGEENMDAYEYVDVRFSEPIAYAADHGMSNCGYTKNGNTPEGVLHGAWGAELIDSTTVRFKVNGTKQTSNYYSYNGTFYEMSPGFYEHPKKVFQTNAIGVKPEDARYKVLSQAEVVHLLTVDNSNASITNTIQATGGDSTTMALSVKTVELKALEQGGDFRVGSDLWCENGTAFSQTGTAIQRTPTSTGTPLVYGLKASALTDQISPGSSLYGYISSLVVTNEQMSTGVSYSNELGKCYPTKDNTLYAVDPMGRAMGLSSDLTPIRAVLSGPVYNMVKVAAVAQNSRTSRLGKGQTQKVLGIDAAGSTGNALTSVTVRAIDTSFGQFDPEIDLEPLADGDASGVQIIKADGTLLKLSFDKNDGWSEWRFTEEGLPYKEVTLRLLAAEQLPTTGGNANSFDYYIQVKTSSSFNFGDSFIIQIPDNGISIGNHSTKDNREATWGISNGTMGFPFTDYKFYDINSDKRWSEGESIASAEDTSFIYPLYDGGKPCRVKEATTEISQSSGTNTYNRYYYTDDNSISSSEAQNAGNNNRNLYYAKKSWATNPESSPFYGTGNISSQNQYLSLWGADLLGSDEDLSLNVSYAPGDAVWYDIGGTPGVYDEGIDIPLFGNADKYPLPWQVQQSGAKSAHFRAAPSADAGKTIEQYISAPSNGAISVVGLNMQDAGRGFGPRYILKGTDADGNSENSVIIETISKNIAGAEYQLVYQEEGKKLSWAGGEPVALPSTVGSRVLLMNDTKTTFIVVRVLKPECLPSADTSFKLVVSDDVDRDIQQPAAIQGVRITAVGRGNKAGTRGALTRSGNTLSWKGGTPVEIDEKNLGSIYVLNEGAEDYIVVQVSTLAGATSEELSIYSSDGASITPFLHIRGLEIMAVSDMIDQGAYTFSYDGAGNLAWGNGDPVNVGALAENEFAIVYGDGNYGEGTLNSWPKNYVVVRRNGVPLSDQAATDVLNINQAQLLKVKVQITGINGFQKTHIKPMSNDAESGISLWWDANADGVKNEGDMVVSLIETPVLEGSGSTYTTVLVPDPDQLTAWLSCPRDASVANTGYNFFVCVNTTVDMSFGDQFRVNAWFYEPTEPCYDVTDTGYIYTATASSGTITSTSMTNTEFSSLTTSGQTIDANTTVGLFSIAHFYGQAVSGLTVDVAKVAVKLIAPKGSTFTPEAALLSLENDAEEQGIVLYQDKNGNGTFEAASDTVIPCYIDYEKLKDDSVEGTWLFTLRPKTSSDATKVPEEDDDKPEHFIALKFANTLPYGALVKGRMENDAISYSTGSGSASSWIETDVLNTSVNSSFSDATGTSLVSSISGLVVNGVGSKVASGYQKLSITYDAASNTYILSWGNYSTLVDMSSIGTYTLGSGTSFITVTLDPAVLLREDTLVCSETGRPDEELIVGSTLTELAGQGVTYHDKDGNGLYTEGETLVFDGQVIFGSESEKSLATSAITKADHLSFWSKNGLNTYLAGYSIFHDTDYQYTVPWTAFFVDGDFTKTAGSGTAASSVTEGTKFYDVASVSVAAGGEVTKGNYLYFIDTDDNGLGYVYGEDIIVARKVAASGTMADLQYDDATDNVVYDPTYDPESATVYPLTGMTMRPFDTMDYLRFSVAGSSKTGYDQGDALFLMAQFPDIDETTGEIVEPLTYTYAQPANVWTVLVDTSCKIRRYDPDCPSPFDANKYSVSLLAGLDLANGGNEDVQLTSVTVRLQNVKDFAFDDLCTLSGDITSGLQLWRDVDGDGNFDPEIDLLVSTIVPTYQLDGDEHVVTFALTENNKITSEVTDGIYDFFVAVQPSETANKKQKLNDGAQFSYVINNSDILLNKTMSKVASVSSSRTLTIDTCPPQFTDETPCFEDSDNDGNYDVIRMTFDELLRLGTLNSDGYVYWTVRDADTPDAVIKLSGITMSEDAKTVYLELAGDETTGIPVVPNVESFKISVSYKDDHVLMDWAGNPVDFENEDVYVVNPNYDPEGGLTPTPTPPTPASEEPDADGDGLPDDWEIKYGLDPLDATGDNGADGDPDGDGITNINEYFGGLNPSNARSNGVNYDYSVDVDTDGDGVCNYDEQFFGTSAGVADTDDDGASDADELGYTLVKDSGNVDSGMVTSPVNSLEQPVGVPTETMLDAVPATEQQIAKLFRMNGYNSMTVKNNADHVGATKTIGMWFRANMVKDGIFNLTASLPATYTTILRRTVTAVNDNMAYKVAVNKTGFRFSVATATQKSNFNSVEIPISGGVKVNTWYYIAGVINAPGYNGTYNSSTRKWSWSKASKNEPSIALYCFETVNKDGETTFVESTPVKKSWNNGDCLVGDYVEVAATELVYNEEKDSYETVTKTDAKGEIVMQKEFDYDGNFILGAYEKENWQNNLIVDVDELRVWKSVVSESNLKTLVETNVDNNATNCVSYFRFDDGGVTAEDFCHEQDWTVFWKHAGELATDESASSQFAPYGMVAYDQFLVDVPEIAIATLSNLDESFCYMPATASTAVQADYDILTADVTKIVTDVYGNEADYRFFWLYVEKNGTLYDAEEMTFKDNTLQYVTANSELVPFDETILIGTANTLDLYEFRDDERFGEGTQVQLVAVALQDDQASKPATASVKVKTNSVFALPTTLEYVSFTPEEPTEGSNLVVQVKKSATANAGKLTIEWYRNGVFIGKDVQEVTTAAEAVSFTLKGKSEDNIVTQNGDVWSFKVFFTDSEGSRSRAIPPVEIESGNDAAASGANFIYRLIGEPCTIADTDEEAKRELNSAPSAPTQIAFTPENVDVYSCLTAIPKGSVDPEGDDFIYHYKWYHESTGSIGTDSPCLYTTGLTGGYNVYVEVYAEDIYGNKSVSVKSSNIFLYTSLESATDSIYYAYENNDTKEKATRILPKSIFSSTTDTKIQTHYFYKAMDVDWFTFIVPASKNGTKTLVSFETNDGEMFTKMHTKDYDTGLDTALNLFDANGKRLLHCDDYYDTTAKPYGTTKYARFDMELSAGTYYVQVFWATPDPTIDTYYSYDVHLGFSEITGQKSLPTAATSVEVTPQVPNASSTLVCEASGAYSSESDIEYYYVWYRNGTVVPFGGDGSVNQVTEDLGDLRYAKNFSTNSQYGKANTIPSSLLFAGDTWQCVVYAKDSVGFSAATSSNIVTIDGAQFEFSVGVTKTYNDESLENVTPDDQSVCLGWRNNATFGFDGVYDSKLASVEVGSQGMLAPNGEVIPGLPGGSSNYRGCFYSIGLDNDNEKLSTDMRPYGRSSSWFLMVEIGDTSCNNVTLSWNTITLPSQYQGGEGNLTITRMCKNTNGTYETIAGTTVDMIKANSTSLTEDEIKSLERNGNGERFVVYRVTLGAPDDLQVITLNVGWNMVALSVNPMNNSVNDVFVDSNGKVYSGTVYEYLNNTYVAATNVVAAKGYWVNVTKRTELTVYGTKETAGIKLSKGWNIVGVVNDMDDFATTYSDYTDIVDPDCIFEFVNNNGVAGYAPVKVNDTYPLSGSKAYWMYSTEAVTLPIRK